MRKIFAIGVMLVVTVQAQQIPAEVQKIMDGYKKNPTRACGFNTAREIFKFDSSIKASDIEVGVPYEEYHFINDSLSKLPDTVPVQSVIESIGVWGFPIRAKGKYIYIVRVGILRGTWILEGMEEPLRNWEKIREIWPEASGNNPIFIRKGNRCFLHFPKQGKHNLFYLTSNTNSDSLARITSRSCDKLDDSRKILKFFKTHKR